MRRETAGGAGVKVIVSGSTGLIGRAVCARFAVRGDVVQRLVRGRGEMSRSGESAWDPASGTIDARAMEGADVVVHLAGEPLAGERWNDAKRARIRSSRVEGTQLLSEALAGLAKRPRVMLSASAIGIYGARGDEILDETSRQGSGFLAEACREWETATAAAERAGIRVVHLRIGLVLDAKGGALGSMLPVFRLGLGGPLGTGRQWMSCISLRDTVRAIEFLTERTEVRGAVNIVGPEPVTNNVFAAELGGVLRRPAVLRVPRWALRAAIGAFADEAVLASIRAVPRRLDEAGFVFEHATLSEAIRAALGRSAAEAGA